MTLRDIILVYIEAAGPRKFYATHLYLTCFGEGVTKGLDFSPDDVFSLLDTLTREGLIVRVSSKKLGMIAYRTVDPLERLGNV